MSCYIKNPIQCFTKLWFWKMDNALTPGNDDDDDHNHNHNYNQENLKCQKNTTTTSVTGWNIGGDDVLVIVTFLLVVLSSLLLRGYLVSITYNAVIPKVWKNAYTMSLGAGMALVGLAVLLIR